MTDIPYRSRRPHFLRRPAGKALLLAVAALAAFVLGRWSGNPQSRRTSHLDTNALPASVRGKPIVIDGDTLDFGNARVRLYGIDAFEREQLCKRADGTHFPCGQFAREMLANLVGQGMTECRKRDVDVYHRVVAVCRVADFDLAGELVKAGVALAYRRYSDDYVDEEAEARAARRGAWDGEFTAPWDWRHDKRD